MNFESQHAILTASPKAIHDIEIQIRSQVVCDDISLIV
jgi:hypothetical protein